MSPQHREPALPSDSPNGVNNDQSKGRESYAGSRTRRKRDPPNNVAGAFREVPQVTRILNESTVHARGVSYGYNSTGGHPARTTVHADYAAAATAGREHSYGTTCKGTVAPRSSEPGDGFITVGRNGRPLRPSKSGSSVAADLNLKPQRPRKSDIVYISNVNPELDNEGLRAEIKRRFGVSVRC